MCVLPYAHTHAPVPFLRQLAAKLTLLRDDLRLDGREDLDAALVDLGAGFPEQDEDCLEGLGGGQPLARGQAFIAPFHEVVTAFNLCYNLKFKKY